MSQIDEPISDISDDELIKDFQIQFRLEHYDLNEWCREWLQFYDPLELDRLLRLIEINYPQYISRIRTYLLLK